MTTTIRTIRWARLHGVVTLLGAIVLAPAPARSQPSPQTVTETVVTRRDINGRDDVRERVVTRSTRSRDEERVVIEIYVPSMQEGRLALSQRVNRVTTPTADGSHTVEETEKPNPVAPSEPMRVVQRRLTAVRRTGPDSFVIERQIFERDGNGRLVLVRTETEHTSDR
jgi:hypothetical protein